MREPSAIPADTLREIVRNHWDLELTTLDFLPLGADAASWVYRGMTAAGAAYLLKLRGGRFSAASVAIPRLLAERGLPGIVAPLPARDGELWAPAGTAACLLYPFIEGRSGADGGLCAAQWGTVGGLARQLHSLELPNDARDLLAGETWEPAWEPTLAAINAAVTHTPSTAEQRAFQAEWRAQHTKIARLRQRAAGLAQVMRASPAPLVLCHADLHAWNMLVDTNEQPWLIDWDCVMLGRKERDLMFVIGGIGHPSVTAQTSHWFLQGYGDAVIDPLALAYYRHAWALQDIAAFSEQIILDAVTGLENAQAALGWFKQLFEPGQIVRMALDDPGGNPA